MNLDEMKRLAELVTECQWYIQEDGNIYMRSEDDAPYGYAWKPDIDGEDWQQAQALQCIVAASKMEKDVQINCFKGASYWLGWDGEDGIRHATPGYDDILTASIAALLASTQSAVENV